MKVTSWEVFPDELQAALTKRYPSIVWSVALHVDGISGVVVWAYRDERVMQVEVPRVVIEIETLQDLVEAIHEEAEIMLTHDRKE